MKELLTKRFWQGVKKTFDEARDDSAPKSSESAVREIPSPAEAAANPEVEPRAADVRAKDCDNGS